MTAQPRYVYTAAELAAVSGLTVAMIYRLTREGTIPKLKFADRGVLIPAWCVDSFAVTGDWEHNEYIPEMGKEDRRTRSRGGAV